MSAAKIAAWRIGLANTPEQVGRCSSVMRELRPHIKAIDFAARVLQQQKEGYQLAFLESDRVVRSVAGFRILNLLFSGRTLYVDDLVTHDSEKMRLGEKLEAAHKGKTFRQIGAGDQLFVALPCLISARAGR